MKAIRAPLLWFDPDGNPRHEPDGCLVTAPGAGGVERVVDVGDARAVLARQPGLAPQCHADRFLVPGFVDLHVHAPQLDVIASPADGLLPWLTQHTFVQEARFCDPCHATEVAQAFLTELKRHGVTTALAFSTAHKASAQALFEAAQVSGHRLITGLCLMDRNAPQAVQNRPGAGTDATEQSLIDSADLLAQWHGKGRLGYAITPRFAPACSDAQLQGAAELAAQHPDAWVQSHVAENLDELAWVRSLYPHARSYLDVYDQWGLLRKRAIYAHGIHLDSADRQLLQQSGTALAFCPTSNWFLGSGLFDVDAAQRDGVSFGLASDVGAGTSFSPFETMKVAYCTARTAVTQCGREKAGVSLSASRLWWLHSAGGAAALGLDRQVGNLAVGCEADWLLLDPKATPLLARRTAAAATLEEWLFAFIILADDRAVTHVHLASQSPALMT
jgi:guanine deaminase